MSAMSNMGGAPANMWTVVPTNPSLLATLGAIVVKTSDAQRSIEIFLVNKTSQTLYWDDSGLEHGKRRQTAPDEIAPGKRGRWMLESSGIMTGCEGWMHWRIGSTGAMLKLDYDNPFHGSNSYSSRIEGGPSGRYRTDRTGGDYNNAHVVFIVE